VGDDIDDANGTLVAFGAENAGGGMFAKTTRLDGTGDTEEGTEGLVTSVMISADGNTLWWVEGDESWAATRA
jgi:hypothetical protein